MAAPGTLYSAVLEHTSNGRNARYEIRVDSQADGFAHVRARWGRIGTTLRVKVLLDNAATSRAVQFAQDKVAEKVGSGYQHVAPIAPTNPPPAAANVPPATRRQDAATMMALAKVTIDLSI